MTDWRILGCTIVAGLLPASPSQAQTCPQPLGVLDSVLVQGTRLDAIDTGQFAVERDDQAVSMNIGDPLCEADRLATRPDTTAKLRVGPEEGPRQELTVLPGTTVILQSVSRVELLIGRLLAAVQGNFDVVMPFARLAATGTEFAVEATPDGCRVEQLEGSTGLTPDQGATARLERLQTTSCVQTAAVVSDLPRERCSELIGEASRIFAAGRPVLGSQNMIRTLDPAIAPAAYAAAREAAICRNDRAARAEVDRVLVDWERPPSVLVAGDPMVRGRAALMRGQPGQAINEFRRGSAGDPDSAVLTGLGDAERDLGLNRIRGNDIRRAAEHFDSATRLYLAARERASTDRERGVILVNLGDLTLLRTRLDPEAAEARVNEAEKIFERARTFGDPWHARLGLARAAMLRASLIPTQQLDASAGSFGEVLAVNFLLAQLAESQRKPDRERAREILQELTASAPGFAPAEELLGDLLAAMNKRDQARIQYQKAIAADPGNTSSYLGYSKTLGSRRQKMYENAYRLVELPAVRERDEMRAEILAPPDRTEPVPAAPLTPDVTRLTFDKFGQQRQVTLTNRGDAAATARSAILSGRHRGFFRIVRDGCGNVRVERGADCSIVVEYSPQETGSHRATLEIPFDGGLGREIGLSGESSPSFVE